MGVYIPNIEKPKKGEVIAFDGEYAVYTDDDMQVHRYPLIEIDLERDIPTIWYNRQTGQYEPKGTKQEVYERLYKLKYGERRSDESDIERD